jgi:transcription initiation factor IIF auxiliary subunit
MKIAQSENYQGDDRWAWAVWIDAPPDEIQSISAVTYTLHPTFRDPTRTTTDRATNFRLEAEGWGTFTIYALVAYQDGSAKKLSHELELHYPDGTVTTA